MRCLMDQDVHKIRVWVHIIQQEPHTTLSTRTSFNICSVPTNRGTNVGNNQHSLGTTDTSPEIINRICTVFARILFPNNNNINRIRKQQHYPELTTESLTIDDLTLELLSESESDPEDESSSASVAIPTASTCSLGIINWRCKLIVKRNIESHLIHKQTC